MSRRRLLSASLAAVVLACCSGLALAATRSAAPERTPPSRAELYRLQDRIDKRWDELARQGIFIESTGHPAEPCLSVTLDNPTPANIAYLQRRFGPDVCVERNPDGRPEVCPGSVQPPLPEGPVTVPDLRDLGLREASRRLVAGGLTYAAACLGEGKRRVLRITRGTPMDLARVVKQCPHAGQRVPAGTEVALDAAAVLPGRFKYEVGALSFRSTGTTKPCQDGRHVSSPSETPLPVPECSGHNGRTARCATAQTRKR